LSASLEQYKAEVQAILVAAPAGPVTGYLKTCIEGADQLNGLEAIDPRVPTAFDALVKKRGEADEALTADTSKTAEVRAENAAYNAHLYAYRKAEYIGLIKLQDELLDRKYFKTETAKNANFLEGYVNGRLPLTRAQHGDVVKAFRDEHLGVSPWEAIFRFEPAMAFENGTQPAILGTAGLSYAFFPTVNRATTPVTFSESVWSRYLQKSGGRVGVGVGQFDDKTRLVLGAGVQVYAAGLWALYEPDEQKFMFAVSMSDLSKIKKIIGGFD